MKILGVIPARGGSKGVVRKNLAEVHGKPLLAYTIEQAKLADRLDSVVVSTEDQEIAEVAKSLGVEVPFLRPDELAGDATPTIDVLVHLCKTMRERGADYDAICLLQATSPMRRKGLIDDCIERFEQAQVDSLVTICEVPHQFNPSWVFWKDDNQRLELATGGVEPIPRRQLLPPAFIRDGRIYLSRTNTIVDSQSLYGQSVAGFEVEPGINIDTPEDLQAFREYIAQSK